MANAAQLTAVPSNPLRIGLSPSLSQSSLSSLSLSGQPLSVLSDPWALPALDEAPAPAGITLWGFTAPPARRFPLQTSLWSSLNASLASPRELQEGAALCLSPSPLTRSLSYPSPAPPPAASPAVADDVQGGTSLSARAAHSPAGRRRQTLRPTSTTSRPVVQRSSTGRGVAQSGTCSTLASPLQPRPSPPQAGHSPPLPSQDHHSPRCTRASGGSGAEDSESFPPVYRTAMAGPSPLAPAGLADLRTMLNAAAASARHSPLCHPPSPSTGWGISTSTAQAASNGVSVSTPEADPGQLYVEEDDTHVPHHGRTKSRRGSSLQAGQRRAPSSFPSPSSSASDSCGSSVISLQSAGGGGTEGGSSSGSHGGPSMRFSLPTSSRRTATDNLMEASSSPHHDQGGGTQISTSSSSRGSHLYGAGTLLGSRFEVDTERGERVATASQRAPGGGGIPLDLSRCSTSSMTLHSTASSPTDLNARKPRSLGRQAVQRVAPPPQSASESAPVQRVATASPQLHQPASRLSSTSASSGSALSPLPLARAETASPLGSHYSRQGAGLQSNRLRTATSPPGGGAVTPTPSRLQAPTTTTTLLRRKVKLSKAPVKALGKAPPVQKQAPPPPPPLPVDHLSSAPLAVGQEKTLDLGSGGVCGRSNTHMGSTSSTHGPTAEHVLLLSTGVTVPSEGSAGGSSPRTHTIVQSGGLFLPPSRQTNSHQHRPLPATGTSGPPHSQRPLVSGSGMGAEHRSGSALTTTQRPLQGGGCGRPYCGLYQPLDSRAGGPSSPASPFPSAGGRQPFLTIVAPPVLKETAGPTPPAKSRQPSARGLANNYSTSAAVCKRVS